MNKKPIAIQIIGERGPIGKTHLQVALAEFLESRGAKVTLSDNTGKVQRKIFSGVSRRGWDGGEISIAVVGV